MAQKNLSRIVAERPFPDYAHWWELGDRFAHFMAEAIVSQWRDIQPGDDDLTMVEAHVSEYVELVYGRQPRARLVADFVDRRFSDPLRSGEFDALSFAFYRSAFGLFEERFKVVPRRAAREKRLFTNRVGKAFFDAIHTYLSLAIPADLDDARSFNQLKTCIQSMGRFLKDQGYLRDHFGFSFDVSAIHAGKRIRQSDAEFLPDLNRNGVAYAQYEMGYPVILPSAVYLYQLKGEAQHHSSRTIEDLFEQIGYQARETDDFDPTDHPPNLVVEFWEIKRMS